MLRVVGSRVFLSTWKNLTGNNQLRHVTSAFDVRPVFNINSDNERPRTTEKKLFNSISLLERTVSRTGKIKENQLQNVLNSLERKEKPSSNQILLLFQCCAELATAERPEVRINNVQKIWTFMKNSGIKPDVSHYNALLRAYLENEHKFSPQKILAEMEEYNVKPNRLTYRYLMTAYCREGDLAGASIILEEMKKASIALNESIFHSLILGHCIAKDVAGAESVLQIMREKSLEINSTTYATFLCGLSICGDDKKFDSILKKCAEDNITFRNDQLLDIIYHLVVSGQNSRAIEMLSSSIETKSDDFPRFLNRLLYKKQYDMCFEIINIFRAKNDGALTDFENNMYRYVAETETFENIKHIAHEWEKKGNGSDSLTRILFYTLRNKIFDKSFQILNEFRETGQPVKELYFWPMVADAVTENNIERILQVIKAMRNEFGIKVSNILLEKLIFDNLSIQPNAEKFLMSGINAIGVPNFFITEAYISSCIRKKRTDVILELSDFRTLPKSFQSLAECVAKDPDLDDPIPIVNLIHNLIVSAINKKSAEHMNSPNEVDLSSGEAPDDIGKAAQDVLDNFILEIASRLTGNRKNLWKKILQELANQEMPVSKTVGEQIKKNWNDPEISVLIDELTGKKLDISRFKKRNDSVWTDESVSKKEIMDRFLTFCKKDMIDEAEKMIKDHPHLIYEACITFMMTLRRTNNEEKLTEYLKNYVTKISENSKAIRNSVFIQNELIRKGFVKEACELIGKSRLNRIGKLVLLDTLKPVFEKGSLEEINMVLNISDGKTRVVTISHIIKFYSSRKDWNKVFNLLENASIECIEDLRLCENLIQHMVNDGALESVKKLIDLLEKKFQPEDVLIDLMFAHACVGDIKSARDVLDKVKTRNVSRIPNIHGISSSKDRTRIAEDLIKILMGDKRFNKLYLYEYLMEVYETEQCDPAKGLELWEQIQEENIVPSSIFLARLGRLLKKNKINIPFSEPIGKWPDWIFECNLTRPLQKQLLVHYQYNNLSGFCEVLRGGVKSGVLTISTLREMLNFIEGTENDKDIVSVLRNTLSLAEWKNAFESGELFQHAKKFGKSDDPIAITNRIPHSFLCDCLMSVELSKIPNEVAQVVLWAYFHEFLKDKVLSKIYETRVEDIIQNRTVLEGVLEFAPYLRTKNSILNFLISRKIFDAHDMRREANYVLHTSFHSDSSQIGGRGRRSAKQSFRSYTDAENERNKKKPVTQSKDKKDEGEILLTDISSELSETGEKMNVEKPTEPEGIPKNSVSV